MGLQSSPRCYLCREKIEQEAPVFAAPCDHERCASAVWHGIHLMEWRERRAARHAERK